MPIRKLFACTKIAAKIDEAVILVCIGQALHEAEYYVGRGNRGAADWWSNKADEYTAHLAELRAFRDRHAERAQRKRAS
jgi:hypothetical protein